MSTFTVLLSKAFLLLVVDTAGIGLLATTDHLHPEANMLTLLPADGLSLPDQIQHILEVAGTSNSFLCAPSKWETAFQICFSSSQKEKFIYSPNACMKFQIGQSEEKAASELESQGSLPPSWPLHGHRNWTFFFEKSDKSTIGVCVGVWAMNAPSDPDYTHYTLKSPPSSGTWH